MKGMLQNLVVEPEQDADGGPTGSRPSSRRCRLCWQRLLCWASASSVLVSPLAWSPARRNSASAPRSEPVLRSPARRWPALAPWAWPVEERWRRPPARLPPPAAARRWRAEPRPPTASPRLAGPVPRASRPALAASDARRLRRRLARCVAPRRRPPAPCAKASPSAAGPASRTRAVPRPRARSAAAIRRVGPRRPEAGQPAWAQRMKRNQSMSRGAQATVQALKSGDSHGGGHSVDLSGGE